MKISITHKWIIPKAKVYKTFEDINKTKLTFGVHKEDNGNHSKRDENQQKPLHALTYSDTMSIGNASLLRKVEQGSLETWNVGGRATSVEIPPREILKPCFEETYQKQKRNLTKSIKQTIRDMDSNALRAEIKKIAEKLDIHKFVKKQAELNPDFQNSQLAKVIKKYDNDWSMMTELMDDRQLIKLLNDLQEVEIPNTILEDSGDLLNSIKSKVE